MNKSDIRKKICDKRRDISPEQKQKAAEAAAKHFIASELFLNGKQFSCYLAQNSEFNCAPIMREIWQQEKNCYLPILAADSHLDFGLYHLNDPLVSNRYNIFEPKNADILSAKKFDVVIMPLVAFDSEGTRLGMGGGYYDRTFSFLLNQPRGKPFLLGLAFEMQQVEKLPREKFDVPLDGVLTEKRLIIF